MKRPKKPSKLRVSYLAHKLEGPGWYWWVMKRSAVYNGPFENEAQCRKDLARLTKEQLQMVTQ